MRRTPWIQRALLEMMAATTTVNLSESLKVLRLTDPTVDVYQVKDFTKYWVVFSSQVPGEGFLHFHKSKSTVQRSPAVFVENLTNMTNINQLLDNGKTQHMLKLSYANHGVFILFASQSTLQHWHKRLRTFLNCYPLFLLKCPQQPHRVGHYILCFNHSKLNVYSTHNGQRVWTWNIGHLRRFSYEPKTPFIEMEPGRSSETGEGNFYFTGKNCKDLFDLLQSLSQSGKTRSSQQPMTKAIPAENMDASTKLPYLELLAPSSAEGTSTCKLAQKPLVRMPNSLPGHSSKKPNDHAVHPKLVSVHSLDSGGKTPKEHHNFIKSQSTDVKKQITANGTSNEAKSIRANGSLQASGGLQANGDLEANGSLQADGDLQSNGDSLANSSLQAQGTSKAHAKLTSISESDFDFDHVYDYIDEDSDDDDGDYICMTQCSSDGQTKFLV